MTIRHVQFGLHISVLNIMRRPASIERAGGLAQAHDLESNVPSAPCPESRRSNAGKERQLTNRRTFLVPAPPVPDDSSTPRYCREARESPVFSATFAVRRNTLA